MHTVLVNEADLYFLAPLRIKDYNSFEDNLISAGWVRPTDVPFDLYAQDALYESEAAFLGILKDGVSPLSKDGVSSRPRRNLLYARYYRSYPFHLLYT